MYLHGRLSVLRSSTIVGRVRKSVVHHTAAAASWDEPRPTSPAHQHQHRFSCARNKPCACTFFFESRPYYVGPEATASAAAGGRRCLDSTRGQCSKLHSECLHVPRSRLGSPTVHCVFCSPFKIPYLLTNYQSPSHPTTPASAISHSPCRLVN